VTDKVKPDKARKLNNQTMFNLVSKRYGLGKVDFAKLEPAIRKLINEETPMNIPDSLSFPFGVILLTFLIRVKAVFIDGKGYVDLEKLLKIKQKQKDK